MVAETWSRDRPSVMAGGCFAHRSLGGCLGPCQSVGRSRPKHRRHRPSGKDAAVEPAEGPVRLDKIKRPAGVFEFDMRVALHEPEGTWLFYPVGSTWRAPHDTGTMPFNAVLLVTRDQPFVTWWVDDPSDRRIEIDVCLPPIETASGWSFVDLELDPVRHEATGRIEIEDVDEFDEALERGWMSADDAAIAKATADQLASALADCTEPWGHEGWARLRGLVELSTQVPIATLGDGARFSR